MLKLKINRHLLRGLALTFIVGALPFTNYAPAYAQESERSRYLDDYRQQVGLTYGASATIQTTYIWRGLYAGGANIQLDANVGYGGLYADLWWNIGTTDWAFSKFLPEVDISLGFKRWGLNVYLLYIHNFDCGFFDFANYAGRGNRLEVNARYTVSSKIPLTISWGTRISAADGYINDRGELKFAYSSYAEIAYTQALPYDLSLSGAIGFSPWKSVYSFYEGDFVVNNIALSLRKDWSVSEHCGLMLSGHLVLNPSSIAADKHRAEWHPKSPGLQAVNANIALGVYLK